MEHFKAGIEQMNTYGVDWETRIATDYYSGRSDRVLVEWVVEGLGDVSVDALACDLHVLSGYAEMLARTPSAARTPFPIRCSIV